MSAYDHKMSPMESTYRRHGDESRGDGTRQRRPARFASVVVEELANLIIAGTYAEGYVLPTEPVLCEEFGFSRTVIREGLKLLEERGLVRVEQGRGTTVQPRKSWNLLDPLVLRIALSYDHDLALLDNLIVVRRVLEQEMASAAAEGLTEAELAALEETIARMEGLYDDYDRFREADQAFHAIVMRASGNEVGQTIVRTIHRHGGALPTLARAASRKALERTAREHRGILDALAARDGDRAAELIAAHIDSAWAERRGRAKRS